MTLNQLNTITAIEQFLAGTQKVAFGLATSKQERYSWVQKTLVKHRYLLCGKVDKGTITRYLMKVTGYSRAQIKRLIQQYVKSGTVKLKLARRNGFKRAYTEVDIGLLASMDERHGQPSGAVLKKLCERAYKRFGQTEYQQLAGISVSHLYNLRASKTYQRQRCTLTKTRPAKAPIGQRRKPRPNNQPGYIRIDSVHQGDQDKRKGIYHVNAVDEVTQFQVIFTLERISEEFMLPALIQMFDDFPFKIRGFHADNGGEYINYTVAELLDKLHIEFTKSRPRHCNDNGLVESKNGSVVRKLYGYMAELLRQQGFRVFEFRYKSDARFQDVSGDLSRAVEILKHQTGQDIHIVAHSFGGLVARTYLQGLSTENASTYPVLSLTTVGMPHSGISNGDDPTLVDGDDGIEIKYCNQVSCIQAGVSAEIDTFANELWQDVSTGSIIRALEDEENSGFQVNDLRVQSLIGAKINYNVGEETYASGDGLITFEGQRWGFNSDAACLRRDSEKGTDFGGALINEYFLGVDTVENGDIAPGTPIESGFDGFAHNNGVAGVFIQNHEVNILKLGDMVPVFPDRQLSCDLGILDCGGAHSTYLAIVDWVEGNTRTSPPSTLCDPVSEPDEFRWRFEGIKSSWGATEVGSVGITTGREGSQAAAFTNAGYLNLGELFDVGENDVTIAYWAKFSDTSGDNQILTNGIQDVDSLIGITHSNGGNNKTRLVTQEIGAPRTSINHYSTSQSVSNWKHFVITRGGTDAKIYVNGVLNSSSLVHGGNLGGGKDWYLGRGHQNGHIRNGAIDDLRIFTKSMTGPEVLTLFQEY